MNDFRYAIHMAGVTIAVQRDGDLYPRKLTKILGFADGGFGVAVPYHSARQGVAFKHPVDYSAPGEIVLALTDLVHYTAEDHVKLSLHLDGFVQFSGENPGKIISGKDNKGHPKGLGLQANRLTTPLSTGGPTFGITFWGPHDLAPLVKNVEPLVLFEPSDSYLRDCLEADANGYMLEGFVYPRYFLSRAVLHRGRLTLPRRFPNFTSRPRDSGLFLPTRQSLFEEDGVLFDLRLVDFGSRFVILGLLLSRIVTDFPSDSGFIFSSPSDMQHALQAIYPNFLGRDREFSSLDYVAPS